ncbi:MAG TPA: hypothetical protein VFP50_18205 [Anaeromyxobacteraceae bacterium]|nr:hypothetical protein [Anaeromyxobacteraceae bacterium]
MAWTSGDLINRAKRTASIPAAQTTFTDPVLLDIANEQLQSYIVPLITSQREDYFVTSTDVPLVNGTVTYRLPPRAVGQALRQVYRVNALGQVVGFPRMSRGDLEGAATGFYLEGNLLTVIISDPSQTTQLGVSLRMSYHQRPNTLVSDTAGAVVAAINTATNAVTLATVPGSFSSSSLYDIVRGRPGYETLGIDRAATLSGLTLTFASALPADLVAGDIINLAGESIYPQIPVEMHPLLSQRVALKCLEELGDTEHIQAAASALARMETDAVKLITPRVAGNTERIVNRGSIFRHRW